MEEDLIDQDDAPKTVLHIGVGKTATSSLQHKIFSKLGGIHYIGRPYRDHEWPILRNKLTSADDYDFEKVRLAERFSGELEAAAEQSKTLLLSDETIAMHPMQTLVARRFREFLPNAEILPTIRNQYTIIPSYYANHGRLLKGVPGRWNGRHVSFEEWFEFCVNNVTKSFFHSLRYFRFADIYASVFGSNNVHVLVYEDLAHDREKFAEELARVLGGDVDEILNLLEGKRVHPRDTARLLLYQRL